MDRRDASARLSAFLVSSIEQARASDVPFFHLQFGRVFPDDVYAEMIREMPQAADYRALPGRNPVNSFDDGAAASVSIDLFPEDIRNLPERKRALWETVGRALCSEDVKDAFVRRLAPALKRRFGEDFSDVGMFPVPKLTRELPNAENAPHADPKHKGISAQFYLPPDDTAQHLGTMLHEQTSAGRLARTTTIPFLPNTGYAFAVGDDAGHSADPARPEMTARDSILHTYFVDSGLLRMARNSAAGETHNLVR